MILFAFNSLSLGTPLALVGIVVMLRELLSKHDPAIEGKIPRGVTVIAALSIFGGANLILAETFNTLYPAPLSPSDLAGLSTTDITLVQNILLALSLLAVIFGSSKILTGLILRNGKPWIWTLGIVTSALSLTLDASSLGAYSTVTASSLEAPTSLLAIIYLTRPYVRAFYGRGPLSKKQIVEKVAIG